MTGHGRAPGPAGDRADASSAPGVVRTGFRSVVVGVPARNEECWIERALTSLRAACDRFSREVLVQVVVAADQCQDRTAAIARSLTVTDPRFTIIEGGWNSAGGARRAAIAAGLNISGRELTASRTWIATTDADTVVPNDWLRVQLDLARRGADAVAGIVELHIDADHTAAVDAAFRRTYPVSQRDHGHVHAANLGVRADAYLAVGGFSTDPLGEDQRLWQALRVAGYRCHPSPALVVATSARLRARAPGGFADTMRARLRPGSSPLFGDSSIAELTA